MADQSSSDLTELVTLCMKMSNSGFLVQSKVIQGLVGPLVKKMELDLPISLGAIHLWLI